MGMSMGASGGGRKYGRRKPARMAEINVTPMVDVMLVLLIIFMVAAPLLTVGVPVDLPKTKASAITQSDTKPLELTVDAKGQIYLQETKVPLESLVTRLQAISNNNHDVRIYIRGDKNVDYGRVVEALAAITNAGFTKVNLVSNLPDAKAR
jgi:biopolymer transport protein TolR